jgi:WD40 repeat protein/tetratricopeptide (TPR) repeat protein
MTYSPDHSEKRNQKTLKVLRRAIAFANGDFSLIFVRCNYQQLRDRLLEKLREISEFEIRTISLMPCTETLYQTISEGLSEVMPNGLMVFGLELVDHLDRLVISTNQVRDEFRKNFPFVLVLWVNDEVLKTFIQKAPDFHSWATTSEVVLSNDELIGLLEEMTDRILATSLEDGSMRFRANTEVLGDRYRLELDAALKDLQNRGVTLPPKLNARVEFVLGRDEYGRDRLDRALIHYQASLDSWWQAFPELSKSESSRPMLPMLPILPMTGDLTTFIWPNTQPSPQWVDQGVILFYRGLCFCRKADREQTKRKEYLIQARRELEKCKEALEESRRSDLLAKFLGQLGVVFHRLSEWKALEKQAQQLLKIDRKYNHPYFLAQDYGFLAEVALQKGEWKSAQTWAQKALETIEQEEYPAQIRGLDLLLLARSQAKLGQREQAIGNLINNLNIARNDPDYDPQVYLDSLKELRSLYFEQEDYPAAFKLKQEHSRIEAQLGLRAFIGAGRLHSQRHSLNPTISLSLHTTVAQEIKASGRQQDIAQLISRLGRNDYKLTVIHGPSGVGKSSLVQAGLVPQLRQEVIGARTPLPILVQVHIDWLSALERSLDRELQCLGQKVTGELDNKKTKNSRNLGAKYPQPSIVSPKLELGETSESKGYDPLSVEELVADEAETETLIETFEEKRTRILNRLAENADRNFLTVLIFDQFEEFFFVNTEIQEKQEFYEFLRDCLHLPFVKVIVSLREDYLHYLLECDRLCPIDTLNQDILNKDIRYYIGNFSKKSAYDVINSVTERSQIQLTPELLDRLVDDLANEIGEVRPIELQVVGAGLQAQNIRTLAEYEQHGPKEKLVERFLEETIADCGPKNERAARLLLYFLTEENGIRPLKTLAELGNELVDSGVNDKQLEMILEILEQSGLLFKLPEVTTNRYQLVHDYLVTFIRQQPQIQQELKDLQQKYNQLVEEKELVDQLATAKEKEQQNLKFTRNLTAVGLLIFVGLSAIAWHQTQITKQAEQQATSAAKQATSAAKQANEARQRAQIAEITATNAATKALRLSYNQLEALVASIKAGKKVQQLNELPQTLEAETVNQLYQTVSQISEMNRLQSHQDSVVSVNVSPDGKFLVSGSIDRTLKIWDLNGQIKQTIFAHEQPITRVAISPDGQLIASASIDKTVKLWQPNGEKVGDLIGHTEGVTGVSFSPNRDLIATSSQDKTIKLWQPDGTLVRTIAGHRSAVTSVSFHPSRPIIASTSVDNTIKLWNYDGKLIKTLNGHSEAVTTVTFSPDGQWIATASWDKTIKLWNADDGTLYRTLTGHRDRVLGVSFSPDGKIMASAGADNAVILWKSDGTKIRQLLGHQQQVRSVSFSPDGKTLASGSSDNTIKLWKTFASGELPAIKQHEKPVLAVAYSPDGKILASASEDKTVRLWSAKGAELQQLIGHKKAVWDVSFSPNGQILASASGDKTVRLWQVVGKPAQKILGQHEARVLAVSFSPNEEMIVSASEDGVMQLWTLKDQKNSKNSKQSLDELTDRGKDGDRWDLTSQKLMTIPAHDAAINRISFSPQGDRFATASSDKTVKIWQTDGTLQSTLYDHKGEVWSVTFSPTGDRHCHRQ